MGILTGPEITSAVHREAIHITPFEPGLVNPASIDLRLGEGVAVYENWVDCSAADHWNSAPKNTSSFGDGLFDGMGLASAQLYIHDIKKKPPLREFKMCKDRGWVIHPGILYLMHTVEQVCTTKYVPVLDGKSSIGRLGIQVHITAGFGDPGYDGQYTLEVTTMHPIRIYPNMRFCQMRFHEMVGKFQDYQKGGHYVRGAAKGAVASAAYTQFET